MDLKKSFYKLIKFFNAKEKIAIPQLIDEKNLLSGQTALIMGGSGGIGVQIARKFSDSGSNVVITSRSLDKLNTILSNIKKDNVKGIVADLRKVNSFEKLLDNAEKCFDSKISILVNCAGYNPKKKFFDISESDYDATMDINIKGLFFISQTVSKRMISNNIKGHILNIGSSSALRPAWTPYEISKWSIRGFTKGLADTLLPYGIVVNSLAPGPTATPMLGVDSNGDIDKKSSPIGRYATPDEIANLAVIMVSELGNLIIGDTMYATGGSGVLFSHK